MDLPTGNGLVTAVIAIAGNIFIIVLVARSVGAYAQKDWGGLVVNLLAGVIIAGLIWANEATVQLLRNVWGALTGS